MGREEPGGAERHARDLKFEPRNDLANRERRRFAIMSSNDGLGDRHVAQARLG